MNKFKIFVSILVGGFLANIGVAGVPVEVLTLQQITPVDNYFTGKVEAVESGKVSFRTGCGTIAEMKRVGDIIEGPIYNADGSVAKEGTLIARLDNQIELIDYKAAADVWKRDLKIKSAKSKAELETDYADLLEKKQKLDWTYLYAPYSGIITGITRGVGYGVGGAGDDVATITKMDPIRVKIPFTSEIVNLVGKDKPVYVYSQYADMPVPAWIEASHADKFTINAYVRNEIIPNTVALSPEQLKMPKAYFVFPVISFYSQDYLNNLNNANDKVIGNSNILGIPERAIHKDSKGEFVWKIAAQSITEETCISKDFTVEKVYVKTGNFRKNFDFGPSIGISIVELKDSGTLKKEDIIIVIAKGEIENGSKVVYSRPVWLFNDGDLVKVKIPAITQPGYYVPSAAIIHESEGSNYVYTVENGMAKLIEVKLVGRTGGTYAIEGSGIKDGVQIIVSSDKNKMSELYDTCPVDIKGTVSLPTWLYHKHATPIVPSLDKIVFF